MKTMFTFPFRTALAALVLIATACTDEENGPVTLEVTPAGEVVFSALHPETFRFGVKSNASWKVEIVPADASWLHVESTAEGFALTADANVTTQATVAAEVVVRAGEQDGQTVRFAARQRPLEIRACGYIYDAEGASVAATWCNGEATLLTDPSGNPAYGTYANGFHVEGDDIYVAGFARVSGSMGQTQGVYWQNGEMATIDPTDYQYGSAYLSDACLKDGLLCVAGRDGINGNTIAQYWWNGEVIPLSDEGKVSNTTDMFVDGEDLYIAGRNGNTACYWKNGEMVDLSYNGDGTYVNSLVKHGEDIYAAGQFTDGDKYVPIYWKNGEPHPLTVDESSTIYGMWVDGEDVYLAGSSGPGLDRAAAYWKNGERTLLTGKTNAALTAVFVVGEHVYALGFEMNASNEAVVKLWQDGRPTDWTDGTTSAYVQEVLVR